jgi:hypothetical protein
MRCVLKRLLAAVLALGMSGYGRGHVAQAARASEHDAYRASGAARLQDDRVTLPMRFALHHEGSVEACGANCHPLVSASGMITADTPRDFENFAHGRDVRGATVVLDSNGGSVLGAIALGREIRALNLTTMVGRVHERVARDGHVRRVWVSPRAECQSMCPFVLLGGVKRYIPPEARVLVHQIWPGDRRDDAAAATYSAEDLVLVQRDISRLVQYTLDMGGGAELLEAALRIPPWEPLRMLSRDELRRTHLDTTQELAKQAPQPPASSGVNAPASIEAISDGARGEINPRGWLMVERAGSAALVRRHPLTVEGDKIGAFEVALACGRKLGSYVVTYAETRLAPDDHDAPTVKHVDLWIEGKTTALDVVSSRLNAEPHELETLANGIVGADLVKSFADAPADSITVRTSSTTAGGTLIRIGNSGFAHAFPQLAAACEALPARIATRAGLRSAH